MTENYVATYAKENTACVAKNTQHSILVAYNTNDKTV